MRIPRAFICPALAALAALSLCACKTLFHPKWSPQEKAALGFNVQGIKMGSPPSHLKIFPQVQKNPDQEDGMDVYQVFNPNPHISILIAWYKDKKLKKIELRYFNAPPVETLKVSGGWEGLRDTLIKDFGPPSEFGPHVALATKQAGLDPQHAQFNGVWIFSRVHRQINFVTVNDNTAGIAVINVADTTPPSKKEKKKEEKEKPFHDAEPPPPATEPGPGFSV